MKAPYLLHFKVPYNYISEQLPQNFSTHRLATAEDIQYYAFDTAGFGIQHMSLAPFYIELFEVDTEAPFLFNLEITSPQHFLLFIIQGRVQFSTPEGICLSHAQESHLALCYKAAGHYSVNLPKGRHIACCINLDPAWLEYSTEKLPVLVSYLQTTPARSHAALPYIRLDSFLRRRLDEALALKRNGHGRIDGFLRLKIAEILEYYSPKATEKQRSLPYRVKEYLDASFNMHGLTSRRVAEYFHVEERTLRNRFKAEFNLTIRDYYTTRRLLYAIDLIHSRHLPVKDVYYPAGYNDESTFRYELRKYGLSRQPQK